MSARDMRSNSIGVLLLIYALRHITCLRDNTRASDNYLQELRITNVFHCHFRLRIPKNTLRVEGQNRPYLPK